MQTNTAEMSLHDFATLFLQMATMSNSVPKIESVEPSWKTYTGRGELDFMWYQMGLQLRRK